MARTAFSGKKLALKKESQIPSNLQKTARKKSQSVKTPKIVSPPEKKVVKRQKNFLKEIKFYQNTTNMLMSKLPFSRYVRETVMDISKDKRAYRFTRTSILALQEAFEAYIVSLLEDSNLCAQHAKRVTLHEKDVNLVKKLSGKRYIGK
ncbi:hypothetical protein GVAV_001940 [Gurleya vavrai]